MALANQRRGHGGNRVELRRVRQGLIVVVEREVDVEAVVRLGRDAGVEPAVQIDHDVDAMRRDAAPAVEIAGDVEAAVVVDGEELHWGQSYNTERVMGSAPPPRR